MNKIVWLLADPYIVFGAIAVIGLGLASREKTRRNGCVVLLLSLIWLYFWSSGFLFCDWKRSMMADYSPRLTVEYERCDAIVDLGGGVGHGDTWREGVQGYAVSEGEEVNVINVDGIKKIGWTELSSASDRAWFAAELWKAGKAPIVIPSARGCAQTDVVFLKALGVDVAAIVIEDEARNTEENAVFVNRLLLSRVKERRPKALLVTSVWHMRRAMLMFGKYAPDIDVVPAPADFENRGQDESWVRKAIPSLGHLASNCVMFHEWLGYWGYKLFRK